MPVIPPPESNPFPSPAPSGIGERLANGIGWIIGEILRHLWEPFQALGAAITQRITDVGAEAAATPLDDMTISEEIIIPGPFRLGGLVALARTLPAWAQLVAFASILVGIFRELATLAAKRLFATIGYAVNREVPTFRMSAEDGIAAVTRASFTMEQLRSDLADEGVSDDRAAALIARSYRWLTATDITVALYRGVIDDTQATNLYRGLGLQDDQVQIIMDTRHLLPTVSDLQHFISRHIFDATGRELFADPAATPDYYVYAGKIGMQADVAELYWLAHWQLMANQEGVRAWHRLQNGSPEGTTFSLEDLHNLLRFNEVHPKYQDALIASSWGQLSAFLVRGMIEAGTINDDESRQLLQWMQIRPDHAELVITWAHRAKHAATRDLTRADLVADYKDKLITRDHAAQDLTTIGYDAGETELILARADYDLAKAHITRRTATIKANYSRGRIDQATAIEQLVELDKPPDEVSDLIDQWDADRHQSAPTLSYEKLISLYTDRVLAEPVLETRLLGIGLPQDEVTFLIDQADRKIAAEDARKSAAQLRADKAAHKIPTKADLAEWLRKGIIDAATFTSDLLAQGYAQAAIDDYARAVGIKPVVPGYKTDAGKLAVATARERFRDGTTDASGLASELGAAGVPQNIVTEIVGYENALLTPRGRPKPVPVVAPYKTAQGKLQVQTALEGFRDRTLTANDLRVALEGIGMPTALAQATVANEVAKLTPPSPALGIPPIPDYQTPEGKQKTATAREAFHRGLISSAELHTQLIALQYPEAFAGAIVDYETARIETPPAAPAPVSA